MHYPYTACSGRKANRNFRKVSREDFVYYNQAKAIIHRWTNSYCGVSNIVFQRINFLADVYFALLNRQRDLHITHTRVRTPPANNQVIRKEIRFNGFN